MKTRLRASLATSLATGLVAVSTLALSGCLFDGLSEAHLDPPPSAPAPQPLVITSGSLPRAEVQSQYRTEFLATGGVGAHRWGSDGLPRGLTIDPDTGIVFGTPRVGGTYTVWVSVGDASGAYDSIERHLEVDPNTEILPPARVGESYNHTLRARTTGPAIWTDTTSLPPGLVLEPQTGRLHGTVAEAGSYTFNVVVLGAQDRPVDKRRLQLVVAARSRTEGPDVALPGDKDWTGFSTSPAGDLNQDGNNDFLIGSPGVMQENHPGRVHVVSGGDEWGSTDLRDAVEVWGESAGDGAGWSVAEAGDFNGDGELDIIVGAPFSDANGHSAGAAYILFGPVTTSVPLLQAGVRLYGEAPGDLAGWAVSGVGDVSGDGLDDVIIGAPGSDRLAEDAGAAYVIFGSRELRGRVDLSEADIIYEGQTRGERMGHDVAQVGDLRGNDLLDFVLTAGAPPAESEGEGNEAQGVAPTAAYVVSSDARGATPVTVDSLRIIRESIHSPGGFDAVARVDLNGDGQADLVLAGQLEEHGQVVMAVTVFYGPLDGTAKLGDANYKLATFRVASTLSVDLAGDVNGDGAQDLVVGDGYGSSTPSKDGAGRAYIVLGPFGEGTEDLADGGITIAGESQGTHVGFSVAGVGDTNADGFDDVLVGAPSETAQGRAWLYLGGE